MPNRATFPLPWSGALNTIFLGGPITGQTVCGTNPFCYDTGAIRLDNSGSSDVTIDKVVVDVHSSVSVPSVGTFQSSQTTGMGCGSFFALSARERTWLGQAQPLLETATSAYA